MALLSASLALGLAEQPESYSGRRLADVLRDLQARGLNIVYSSAVVRPDMIVSEEPRSTEPRAVLLEVLAPYGLVAEEAAGETLVIVPDLTRSTERSGTIRGIVIARGDPSSPGPATVIVEGTRQSATAADDGHFVLEGVPVGMHAVTAQSAGHHSQRIEGVAVRDGRVTTVRFELSPLAVFLQEVIVTPSHFRILESTPESRQFLSRTEVEQMPHAADDLYRAMKRLPGAAGGDFTAQSNVRGGETEELLVLLDGAELYEPFHLKDFQSIFSVIDSAAVGGVDLLTGGYPAEFGDRMSGVMAISMATPSGPPTTTVALSTINARGSSEGSFDDGKGTWLVSARAWYPDAVLDLASGTTDELLTDYYDLLARVEHGLGSHSALSTDLLLAYDDLGYRTEDEEETEEVAARYGSHHLWFNLHSAWSDRVFSRSVFSLGRIVRERSGGRTDIFEGTLTVDDNRSFDFIDLRQDWSLDVNPRHFLKWGFDVTFQEGWYDYARTDLLPEVDDGGGATSPTSRVVVDIDPEGWSCGLYVADRLQPVAPLIVELGLRWDYQSWIEEHQLSPRVNLMYTVSPHTTVRAAWGRFHQSQRLNELQVEDGVTRFYPAQRAEHWLASVEHRFRGGLGFRIEAYLKNLSDLKPRFENLFSPIELFPESRWDRIRVAPERGRSAGLELLVKHTAGRRLSWWLSYAFASTEDYIDNGWRPRNWDQRHAATLGVNLSLPRRWNLNLAGIFHSGWPTTEVTADLVEGPDGEAEIRPVLGARNASRYPPYRRIDVRASKRRPIGSRELTVFIEAINVFNTRNVCCIDDFEFAVGEDGSITVTPQQQYWAPIIPSIGFSYRF